MRKPETGKIVRVGIVLVLLSLFGFAFQRVMESPEPESGYVSPPDSNLSPKPLKGDSVYNSILARAEQYYKESRFEECLTELNRALLIKPKDPTLKGRVIQVQGLIAQQKKNDEEFARLMASGDTYFKAKNYLDAKSSYQLALNIKPNDSTAKQKLNETMTLLRSQKATNILYDVAIANANKYFEAGDYDKAITEYQNASKIMPDQMYPKDKINEILKIKVDKQVREELYAQAITKADNLYNAKKFQGALAEYQNALKQKPDEQYPKARIKELTDLLAKLKNADDAYKQAIALADQQFDAKQYADSRTSYQDALKIKPDETYPKSRIAQIDGILASLKKADQDYEAFISLADSFYIQKNFLRARQNYQLALQVKPNESYPKEMLAKTESGLSRQELDSKALDEAYNTAIAGADKFFAAKSWDEARKGYQEALGFKPNETYPKDQIKKIDQALGEIAAAKALDAQYDSLIAVADKQLADKAWEEARAGYVRASGMKPAEAYPKTKIAEIDKVLGDLAKQKSMEQQYQAAITEGDRLLEAKSYQPAKTKYQAALSLKPEEEYPKTRIAEIDGIFAQQKALEDQYLALVSKADTLFAAKTYEEAKKSYQEALGLKPAEPYPQNQIAKIDAALMSIAKQKELDDRYTALISKADQLFGASSWQDARSAYVEASGLKPAENYPKTKIAEIDKQLGEIAKQSAIDAQYQGVIATADSLFALSSYEASKSKYQAASTLKPAEEYPKTKIAEIDGIFAKQKALEDQYQALIAEADKQFTAKVYDAAKKGYQDALGLKPAEKYPQDQIAKIDAALMSLVKQKELDDQYAALITKADQLFGSKSWREARSAYVDASGLKPAEAYPKTKIAEIDKELGEIAKQKAIDDQYQKVVAAADSLFALKSYEPSRSKYQAASALKPAEEYPKTKIAEIDGIFAKQKALEDQYQALIADADKQFAAKSYDAAKKGYQDALGLKPSEKYPQDQIAKIDATLLTIAKQKELDDQYAALITKADQLFGSKSWQEARSAYVDASGLKPLESYPKTKIAEIDKELGEIAKQKAIDDQYQKVIAAADSLFALKSYEPSKSKYQAASTLKPAEEYPRTKITEIDGIFAKQKALEDQYQALIADADKQFAAKSYDAAKKGYQDALGLKPGEKYPQDQISKIDAALLAIAKQQELDNQYAALITKADKLFGTKSWQDARAAYVEASGLKPSETYPKNRIAEVDKELDALAKQKALDDRYQSTIISADSLLALKAYEPAKTKYQAASALKPEEAYPKSKINQIDGILADIAKQKALDDQYADIISRGDQQLSAKAYDDAAASYNQALGLKPDEKYPKDKLAEITSIKAEIAKQKALDDQYAQVMAGAGKLFTAKSWDAAKTEYSKASGLKPAEAEPKAKIAQIDSIFAARKAFDDAYAAAIAEADKLFAAGSFQEAKDQYQKASEMKPTEAYPKTRMAEADKQLNDIARKKAIDDQYKAAIAAADKLLADKSYDDARAGYQGALKIKPAEQYPQDKIKEIDAAIAEIARQKAIDDKYKAQVAKADQSFAAKQYEQSKTEYGLCLQIKPGEQYPSDRIAEIDRILQEIKATNDAYKSSIAKADQLLAAKSYEEARAEYQNAGTIKPDEAYPKDKISQINALLLELKGKQATYDNLIKSADDQLATREYAKSKDLYQQASGIFPEETYPKNRIAWINRTVDSIYRVNKADYDRAVGAGDKFFNSFEFDKAIDSYTEALGYLPMENYPKEQIARIRKTIAENAIVDVLKAPLVIKAGDEKKFDFQPVNIASRKNNFIYIKIRNLSGKPFNILMRYGVGPQANGGVVIKNVSVDGSVNDRLISVRDQDLWYRADNNWISLYPQGGDIEVSFIQISKSN